MASSMFLNPGIVATKWVVLSVVFDSDENSSLSNDSS